MNRKGPRIQGVEESGGIVVACELAWDVRKKDMERGKRKKEDEKSRENRVVREEENMKKGRLKMEKWKMEENLTLILTKEGFR